MTIFVKAKLEISGRQTNIDIYLVAAHKILQIIKPEKYFV